MANSPQESLAQQSPSSDTELPVLKSVITREDDQKFLDTEIPDSEADLDLSSPVKESPVALPERQEPVEDAFVSRNMFAEGMSDGYVERIAAINDPHVRYLGVTSLNDKDNAQNSLESESTVAVSDGAYEHGALAGKESMSVTQEIFRPMGDGVASTIGIDPESTFRKSSTTGTEVKLSNGGQIPPTREGTSLGGDTVQDLEVSPCLEIPGMKESGGADTLMATEEKILGSEERLPLEVELLPLIRDLSGKNQIIPAPKENLTTFQHRGTASEPSDNLAMKEQTPDDNDGKPISQETSSSVSSLPSKIECEAPESNNQPKQTPSAKNPITTLTAPTKPTSSSDPAPSKPSTSPNRDVLLAELKSIKMASLQARNAALEAEIASQRAKLEKVTKELRYPAGETVKRHIKLLHDYNDIRDVGQGLIGLIADNRGVRIGELYEEFGVGLKD